jgi:hypothetical protein
MEKYKIDITPEEIFDSLKKRVPDMKGFYLGVAFDDAVRHIFNGTFSNVDLDHMMDAIVEHIDTGYQLQKIHQVIEILGKKS